MLLDTLKKFPTLWVILACFAVFPVFTSVYDLPFWNDVMMRIMLLGMAAMGLNLVLGFGGMISFGRGGLRRAWGDYRIFSASYQRHLFHHDHAGLCADAVFFLRWS